MISLVVMVDLSNQRICFGASVGQGNQKWYAFIHKFKFVKALGYDFLTVIGQYL
ncbi:hypothetical protein AO381_0544 [Moraxella catarrhalis]|nr:hypothetical protein AO381_0544 [Moraxella catarrhalis]OAV08065.1 hypothetical protein AO378_1805 [Moraxella catarrhalis]OAV10344.1 hypothetical protein AO380_0761 [Moraxella catarrhalis]